MLSHNQRVGLVVAAAVVALVLAGLMGRQERSIVEQHMMLKDFGRPR